MIPKIIHYCWFGRGEKSALEKECIGRFRQFAPGFEIIEWNEDSFDVDAHPYTQEAYKDKKWAFVSDYARLKILAEHGGIYLDTDMFLLKDLTPLLNHECFLGREDSVHVSAGIIGTIPKHPFIKAVLEEYEKLTERVTIPRVLSSVYEKNNYNIKVYEADVFYPFDAEGIKLFDKKNPPAGATAVHMWNYSWGSPMARFVKKIGIYTQLKKISEKLKIKKVIKRVLTME